MIFDVPTVSHTSVLFDLGDGSVFYATTYIAWFS